MAFVRMSGEQLSARIAECIRERVGSRQSGAMTVVIDGKAAAGKSYLAAYLEARLAHDGVNVCRIEADWFWNPVRLGKRKSEKVAAKCRGTTIFLRICTVPIGIGTTCEGQSPRPERSPRPREAVRSC